jgi:lysophospholipase L1-like esterase
MRRLNPVGWLLLASSALATPSLRAATPADFALKNGDTVVMYGDSITAQTLYTQFVQLYVATRFPSLHIHFIASGVGGDKVSGGYGGPIDQRLARDVFPYKPTLVTIMLGMNDGGYVAGSDPIETAYLTGYTHLLDALKAHVPGVKFTLIGPSAYDDVTRTPWLPGGYNAVLQHYAELDRQLAKKFDASFVNFNPPVVALLNRANTLDPLLAQQLLPDRIHPTPLVHWVMAEALLNSWNAPALVSSVTIDATAATALQTENATITHLTRDHNTLTWTETDAALPLPFDASNNAADALLLRLTNLQQQLNQQPLRITGLPPGSYDLLIDTTALGPFTAADLAAGINLADYPTPMRSQAQGVAYAVSDYVESRRVELRRQIDGLDSGAAPRHPGILDTLQARDESHIYEAATPRPHHYQLTPYNPPVL